MAEPVDRNEEATSSVMTPSGDMATDVANLRNEMGELKKLLMTSLEEREDRKTKNDKDTTKQPSKKRSASRMAGKSRNTKAANTGSRFTTKENYV